MDLTELKIFVAVATEGSATKAARFLNMTQPGVSQHLARLENSLGVELFQRVGKKLKLNERGKLFLGKAKKLLDEAEQLKSFGKEAVGISGELGLGLTDSSAVTVIPPALAMFRKCYPLIHVRLDVHDSGEIEEEVLRGHYDFGIITSGSKVHPRLEEEILYYDRIDAMVSKQHPLAKRKRVSLKTLAQYPLLLYPRRSRTRQTIDYAFESAGIFPKEIIEVYYNTAAAKLAEIGVGVALLSTSFIESELPKQKCVHIRVQGDPFKRAISIVRRKDTHLSDAAACFYKTLKEHIPCCEIAK